MDPGNKKKLKIITFLILIGVILILLEILGPLKGSLIPLFVAPILIIGALVYACGGEPYDIRARRRR
jgi:hypothetical protein